MLKLLIMILLLLTSSFSYSNTTPNLAIDGICPIKKDVRKDKCWNDEEGEGDAVLRDFATYTFPKSKSKNIKMTSSPCTKEQLGKFLAIEPKFEVRKGDNEPKTGKFIAKSCTILTSNKNTIALLETSDNPGESSSEYTYGDIYYGKISLINI